MKKIVLMLLSVVMVHRWQVAETMKNRRQSQTII